MASFMDIVDVNTDEVEAPPVLPAGIYVLEITKPPKAKESSSGEWEMINYSCKVADAYEVDEDDLEDFGSVKGEPGMITFMSPTADDAEGERRRAQALNQIKKFHVDVLGQEEGNLRQLMAECKGLQFLAVAAHEDYQGEAQVRWSKPMPIED